MICVCRRAAFTACPRWAPNIALALPSHILMKGSFFNQGSRIFGLYSLRREYRCRTQGADIGPKEIPASAHADLGIALTGRSLRATSRSNRTVGNNPAKQASASAQQNSPWFAGSAKCGRNAGDVWPAPARRHQPASFPEGDCEGIAEDLCTSSICV